LDGKPVTGTPARAARNAQRQRLQTVWTPFDLFDYEVATYRAAIEWLIQPFSPDKSGKAIAP
jgi:hypothetical protein